MIPARSVPKSCSACLIGKVLALRKIVMRPTMTILIQVGIVGPLYPPLFNSANFFTTVETDAIKNQPGYGNWNVQDDLVYQPLSQAAFFGD